MKFEFMEITPEMAKDWLETRNLKNRRLSPYTVRQYRHDIITGVWQKNPESISFYENGLLRDGQHRLAAIAEADIPVNTLVVWDVPNESTLVDSNRPRTLRDKMVIEGKTGAISDKQTIAVVRFLLRLAMGIKKPSTLEVEGFLDRYKAELLNAYEIAYSAPATKRAPLFAGIFVALMGGVEERVLLRWADSVSTGFTSDISESAAIVMRNLNMELNGTRETERVLLFESALLSIRDFNHGEPRFRKYNLGVTKKLPYWDEFVVKYLAPYYSKEGTR